LLEINKLSYSEMSKKYGVSDNAIRKWFLAYGVNPPKKHKNKLHQQMDN
jgi:hypothetical protein